MTREEFLARDVALRHAIQTGVAYEMASAWAPGTATEPKHLRTGLDATMADLGGLVQLLIDKGLITEAEYFAASIRALEAEVQRYEARLSEAMGATIRLG